MWGRKSCHSHFLKLRETGSVEVKGLAQLAEEKAEMASVSDAWLSALIQLCRLIFSEPLPCGVSEISAAVQLPSHV